LEIDGALVSDLSLKLDWQLQHDADGGGGGSSSSLVAALPPQVDWQAISQAAVHCQDCDGFTGSLGAAAISLEASSKVGSGTVVFVLKNVQLAWPEAGTQRRRRLQQQQDGAAPAAAAAADCALQVGSQQLSFQGCQTVDLQPSIPYQVFYTHPAPAAARSGRGACGWTPPLCRASGPGECLRQACGAGWRLEQQPSCARASLAASLPPQLAPATALCLQVWVP
jgi:hypothetical protein